MRTPLFIESWQGEQFSNLQVCRMIAAALFQRKVAPLPFATNAHEVRQVAGALCARSQAPSIYVINTYWAEELLHEVDEFIGDTPVLLMRRELYCYDTIRRRDLRETSLLLQGLRPRLTGLCGYGAQNAELVAQRAAQGLHLFLSDGDFLHVERLGRRLTITA